MVLRCEAVGHPEPRVQWTKNGREMVGQTGSRLVIHSLSEADVANYACNASNMAGYDYKNVIVTILTVAARIVNGWMVLLLLLAATILLLCLLLRLRGRFTKEQGYYGVADMERQGGVRGEATEICYTTGADGVAVPPLCLTPTSGSAGSLGSLISDELCLTEGQTEDGSFRQGYIC